MIIPLCLQVSRHLLITICIVLALMLLPPTQLSYAAPVTSAEPYRYFFETGHSIGGRVKAFYEQNGDQAIVGLPLTEVVTDGDLRVQYFERARFEIHSDRIELTLLGCILTAGRLDPAFAWHVEAPAPDLQFFPESGHSLGGAFAWFWKTRGGLPIFGYPISEEFTEASVQDGQPYLVQYFQRARFEYHPEDIGTPNEVRLEMLGRQYAQIRQLAPEVLAPTPPLVNLGTATTIFPPTSSAAQNIALAARRLDGLVVQPGETVSFLTVVGEMTQAAGFVEGNAIVGGRIVRELGGGVCQVSSILYRTVFSAGLEIVERHPHSRQLAFFADAPGFEAAVYAPGMDLRWRNDTPYDIFIAAEANESAGTLTISLWGRSDGRITIMTGPVITDRHASVTTQWRYAPSLREGEVRQVIRKRTGMDAVIRRIVRSADGQILHQDTVTTHYKPWAEIIPFGAGVAPPRETMTHHRLQ